MATLFRARILVIGAGVMGLASALALRARGGAVEVWDPSFGSNSASAVAAGMVSPAFEAALEEATAERAELYRRGAELWPAFSERHALGFVQDGAEWRGPVEPMGNRLRALGFPAEETAAGLLVASEGRLDAAAALRSMADALGVKPVRAERIAAGGLVEAAGRRERFDAVVLAAGWSAAGMEVEGAPEPSLIFPIKGQLAVLGEDALAFVPRTIRGPGVYLTPQNGSVVVGATMETGRSDLSIDEAAIGALLAGAARVAPGLQGLAPVSTRAGVRGATPDGLPMVGASSAPGVFLALAPRRNGWLLAPLAADVLAGAIAGEDPSFEARAFDPQRFLSPA